MVNDKVFFVFYFFGGARGHYVCIQDWAPGTPSFVIYSDCFVEKHWSYKGKCFGGVPGGITYADRTGHLASPLFTNEWLKKLSLLIINVCKWLKYMYLFLSLQKSAELDILDRIGQMAPTPLILMAFQRVMYSESVNKMLQHGIKKFNFFDGLLLVLHNLIKLWTALLT